MKRLTVWVVGLCLLGARGAKAEWYDDMKIKGDLRYRFEQIKEEDKDSRQRDRIRARFGVFPRVNNEVDAGIQFSTDEGKTPGLGDPISGNATLTDEGSKKGVFLDLAYVNWHPEMLKGLDLFAGKMKNPLIQVGDGFPVDGDFNPEGIAAKFRTGDEIEFMANAAYQWLYERSADDDTKLFAGQIAVKFKPADDMHLMVGSTLYGFQNVEGFDVLDYKAGNNAYGNSTVKGSVSGSTTNKAYANEYMPIEGFVEFGFNVGLPVTLFASYINNSEADDDNQGYMGGLKIGKASSPKTFEFGYNYQELEKDAFLGALVDSDSWGGGTDGKGHRLSAKYQILKNWQTGVTYFINDKKIDDSKDYKRLQIDLVAKF